MSQSTTKAFAVPAVRTAGRDTRLDVLRAIALLMIFIDHVPGQIFEYLTLKNYGFSDAAETFVLISGIAVALAYGKRFDAGRRMDAAWKAVKRACTLYSAHMITTFITLALFIAGALVYHRPGLLCEINILPVLTDPGKGIAALLLLGHQIGYNNILPMYGCVMLMVPAILWLESKSPILLLVLSGALWLAAGIFQIAPHNVLLDGYWFLNPLSWQFLFVIGTVSMMHVRRGGTIPRSPVLMALAGAYLVISFVWVVFKLWGLGQMMASLGLPTVITGFDKTFLSLPRLLHVLSMAYLVISIPAISAFFRRPESNPLVILGRHSLNIFVAGTILAMVGQVTLYIVNGDRITGALYVLLGLAAHFAYAYYLEYKRTGEGNTASADVRGQVVPVRVGQGNVSRTPLRRQ